MTASNGDISILLENLGRASTPQVSQNRFNISLYSLIGGVIQASHPGTVLVISSPELIASWPEDIPFVSAVPGIAIEQASSKQISTMVIDTAAFLHGPWLGAADGGSRAMAQEVFDAGRAIRAKGGIVYLLPDLTWEFKAESAFITSTSTVAFGDVPSEDLEEQAPQSALWRFLARFFYQTYEKSPEKGGLN